MKIEPYSREITSEMMTLLLTADPDESAIRSYLRESKVLVCVDEGRCIGIALLMILNDQYELKNIAVSDDHQGKGLAKLLITEIRLLAKSLGAVRLEVGMCR